MKRQVRLNVFETNSSSTHSLVICTEQDFNDWEIGRKLFDNDCEKIIEAPKLDKNQQKKAIDEYIVRQKKEKFWSEWDNLSKQDKDAWFAQWADANILNENYSDYKRYLTREEYYGQHEYMDFYTKNFATPNGDKMVAFGYYGHD